MFPEQVKVELCSWNRCAAGHKWPVTAGLAKCGGCGGMVLAVKMENCPVCNEPSEGTQVRTDYLPHGGPILMVCRGQAHPVAMTNMIEIERTHAKEIEETGSV